ARRRRHTRFSRDWSSDVRSADLPPLILFAPAAPVDLRDAASDPAPVDPARRGRVEVHPDQEGLAPQLALGERTPKPAVVAPVAVVAPHEILALWNPPFALPGIEAARPAGLADVVGAPGHGFFDQLGAGHVAAAADALVRARRAVGERLAVHVHGVVAVGHHVAGQPDHALDPVLVGVVRRAEHHHVAALRLADP